ncbi:MAG: sodium-dependent transporter [Bacteroidales bacterium]|nr:sodium-dependent transporter [Bacteroidales bacterium]MBK9358509.1 sodium-dependent transporter [Bacteroidales bacterium]
MTKNTESWGSRVGLVLAMAGNAVGFGNFLRFPVQAVQNGGGAFIIPYLVSFLLMGIPLLFIEWSSGRFGGKFGHHSTPFILQSMDKRWIWKYVGVFGIFSNIAIAAYYCYIESWTMSYIIHSLIGSFDGLSQHAVANFFTDYLDISTSTTGIPYEALVFFVLCIALNTWILSKGLSGGIEKVAKIGVPLLIVFGIFLAIKGVTLKAGINGAIHDGTKGLNFLWTPDFTSLANPKVWLAAAGQIFFTLSVGMGSIQCYASFLKKRDDVALNAMSAGWMNEFVEVVLGSAVIIPIAIGYLGIDKVVELTNVGGLGLGFRTMPFLFEQWGPVLSAVAGSAFFGLLFFAGITSSLAMGTPGMGFMMDEFKWSRKQSALAFGLVVMILGLPTIFFFNEGVFDEYDYWAGTVSLVVFALLEAILFSWVFGLDKGWKEITAGADIKVPLVYRFIIKYITPVALILVFTGALIRPANDDWTRVSLRGWTLHNESILGQLQHKGAGPNNQWFSKSFYAEAPGIVDSVYSIPGDKFFFRTSAMDNSGKVNTRIYQYTPVKHQLVVEKGDIVTTGQVVYIGKVINRVFFMDMARMLLLTVFLLISLLVFIAWRNRTKERRNGI